jgi:ribosomal protein L37AE/L43A
MEREYAVKGLKAMKKLTKDEIFGRCPHCKTEKVLRHCGEDVVQCTGCRGLWNVGHCFKGLFSMLKFLQSNCASQGLPSQRRLR